MIEYELSDAELAILSLIAEKPRHGYELEEVIEERGMRAWTDVAFSSIYFILNGLTKKGLAEASLQPAAGRGPAKKVFHATQDGHRALYEGIRSSIALGDHDNRRFLLGLSCLPLLSREDVIKALEQRMEFMNGKIREFTAHPALTQPGFPAHIRAMFEYSLAVIRAELDWSQNFLDSYMKGQENGKSRS